MEKEFTAELGFFESFRERVCNLLKHTGDYSSERFIKTAKVLLEKFNQEYSRLNELMEFEANKGLRYIAEPHENILDSWYATFYGLLPECDKAIEGLKSKTSSLAVEQSLKLKRLKEEIKKELFNVHDENYDKNISEAIKECENGYFLGSALISSRLIDSIINQISGKNVEEKIETLKENGIITEKGKTSAEFIMKADKKARNYFSHNLGAFPDSGEALELLGICSRLVKIRKNIKDKGR